jgi:hypothetical protein
MVGRVKVGGWQQSGSAEWDRISRPALAALPPRQQAIGGDPHSLLTLPSLVSCGDRSARPCGADPSRGDTILRKGLF